MILAERQLLRLGLRTILAAFERGDCRPSIAIARIWQKPCQAFAQIRRAALKGERRDRSGDSRQERRGAMARSPIWRRRAASTLA